jgi:hypothetical protein
MATPRFVSTTDWESAIRCRLDPSKYSNNVRSRILTALIHALRDAAAEDAEKTRTVELLVCQLGQQRERAVKAERRLSDFNGSSLTHRALLALRRRA